MSFGTAPKHSNRSVVTFFVVVTQSMHVSSVGSFNCFYRNASHHEHPCTAVVLTLAWHPFIRVDTTSEAVYELVAEPISEPQAGEPQAEAATEPDPKDLVNPADLQGKPRSITHNFSILMFI